MVRIRLLGSLVVEREGVVLARLEGQKYGAVLAHLAMRPGRAVAREVLLGTHWPEVAPSVARNRLSVALSVLRKLLEATDGAEVLVADRGCVALNPTQIQTDVQAFERSCAQARTAPDPASRRAALEEAWSLYAGPLLQGFDEDWIAVERERLACAHEDVEKALQIEVAVPWTPEAPAPAPAPAPVRATAPLPSPLTRFFGREEELRALRGLVEGGARLITVLGPGGMGKTRLAIEGAKALVASGLRAEALWVPIVDVRSAEGLVHTLLLSAGGQAGAARDPRAALSEHLGGRRAVLVLDNAEHLIEEVAGLLSSLLSSCPEVVALVTSQRTLLIDGEHLLRLSPLAAPAVDLLADRIRQHRPDYRPDAAERQALERLAQRLDGLPLALELAAARLRQGSAADSAERLEPQSLTDRRRDRPMRQHSLRDALDWTLALLPPALRTVFLHLSVFSGEIGQQAAQEVCGSPSIAADLLELSDCSLLVPVPDSAERYRILPTVRALAWERIPPAEREGVQGRFRDWFLALARQWQQAILEGGGRALAPVLAREQPNLDAAMDLASPLQEAEAVTGTVVHTLWTGRARVVLPRIVRLFGHPDQERWPVAVRANLVRCGHRLSQISGLPEQAALWRERARALLAEGLPDREAANLWAELALAALDRGALAEARSIYEAQLATLERLGADPRSQAVLWDALARTHYFAGDHERSLEANARAVALVRDQGDPQLMEVLAFLEAACLSEREPERGLRCIQEIQERRIALGQPIDPMLLISLAMAEANAGRAAAAVVTAREALARAKGEPRLEAFASESLAVALLGAGDPEAALPMARAAEQGFRALRRTVEGPRPILLRAECLWRLGDPAASPALRDAIRAVQPMEGTRNLSQLRTVTAKLWPARSAALEAAVADGRWRELLATWLEEDDPLSRPTSG